MSLYRDFESVEELDAQYRLELSVPNTKRYIIDFNSRSAERRACGNCSLDIPYGQSLDETFDLFAPDATEKQRPALFFIHGGYWKSTQSKTWSFIADGMDPHGVVTVVENYALAPGVSIAEIVRQHRAAFAAMWKSSEELGIDRERIVIAGHSAGGHAVGALLGTNWAEFGLPDVPYAAAIPISAIMDLRPLRYSYVAPWLQLSPSDALELSPQLQAPARLPATFAVVGSLETAEFRRQTRDWVDLCTNNGFSTSYVEFKRNHYDILEELADPAGGLAQLVANVVRFEGRGR
jgi:arylformamidase